MPAQPLPDPRQGRGDQPGARARHHARTDVRQVERPDAQLLEPDLLVPGRGVTMRSLWPLLVVVGASGCSAEAPSSRPLPPASPECTDDDGDGFGTNCAAGPDCDDADPNRWDDCSADSSSSAGAGGAPAACVEGDI